VNSRGQTYLSDIAIYQDTLHIIYDDEGAKGEEVECPGCADIYYRRSTNRGLTWLAPVALFPTGTGSSRAQIEIDRTDTIYVAWDEGWDRRTSRGEPQYGVYIYSTDGGSTWSAPTSVLYPNATNAQLSVGSDGQGGVMLVWRTTSREYPGIYYMWSVDRGKSWSPPQTLPDIVARVWSSPFDLYDMATDSAGYIHLLVTGHLSEERVGQEPPGLYHFEWDGNSWSPPVPVYEGSWHPEYPHLAIHQGNQLHAAWFVREGSYGESVAPHQVWYAHGQSTSPAQTPISRPTFTPMPTATPSATATPTATPYPTLSLESTGLPDGLYTESDEVLRLAIALSPAVLVILAVAAVKMGWFGRLRR
jgi:hypothetical protein